ncbi:hypothetical protein NQ036_04725 [Brevibacterium sp. 91QC2O2]|uniref:hypothetical protein n=1 Tax=Brevibacterium TaxID=1696 RepID=UPI00211C6927|nr:MULTISPECIES: hypothetical protein [unclassified Brevibacterium]MCQ9367554.1 hypothetical protein [Brevibacterium sp. 91QC2O2]MCQ9386310.1 hypothetical protein [Brevibacterium sp. 68QC2CO]
MAKRSWRTLWRNECGGLRPDYRILVPDSVSPGVIDAWRARGYRVSAAPNSKGGALALPGVAAVPVKDLGTFWPVDRPGMRRNLLKSNAAYRFTETAGAVATGATAIPATVSTLATDQFAAGGFLATGIVAAVSLAAAGYTGVKYHRDPKRLRNKDKKSAAGARWITPEMLGYTGGRGGQDTDEQRLFQVTCRIARKIAATTAWTHPLLTDHVAKVDLDHAVASIGQRLVELYRLRAELERVREPQLADQIDAYQDQLATAFNSLSGRVLAMSDYLLQLQELDVQLRLLEHSETAGRLGERVLDVLARTAADEDADWRFRELGVETQAHAEAIHGMLTHLDVTAGRFDDIDRQLDESRKQEGRTQ